MAKSPSSRAEWLASRHQADWQWIAQAYQSNTRFLHKGKRIFTDKSHSNSRLVGAIKLALPNSKIIIVQRDPLDTCLALYRQLFEPGEARYAYQPSEIVKRIRSHQTLLAHWSDVAGEMIHTVHYEDLIDQPRASIDAILKFCDLKPEQDCYDFHASQDFVNILSSKQVREPFFRRGIDRKKNYQTQLKEFEKLLADS